MRGDACEGILVSSLEFFAQIVRKSKYVLLLLRIYKPRCRDSLFDIEKVNGI